MTSSSSNLASRISLVGRQVLIQGEEHSFHHKAVQLLLPSVKTSSKVSFPVLAQELEEQPALYGLMAIENSVAGALLTNYLLLEEHHLTIIGEVYLRISHSLLGTPGTTIDDLKQIESHPMALAQCRTFFKEHREIRPVETYDTAGAAKAVSMANDLARGAIAATWCAEAYGLSVLAKAIEDNPHNWTRFVLVAHAASPPGGNKSSIAFSVNHQAGNLVKVLQKISDAGMSLTKIQSLPIVGKPWAYRFFADFLHEPCPSPIELLRVLDTCCNNLIHLGTYCAGQHHEP